MKKKLIVSLALLLCLSAYPEEVTQQDVQRFSSYYSNGMEYLKNQQYSSAITEFRKVLRFSPYDPIVQGALANAYMARAQYYKDTTKEYKKALVDYKSVYFYTKLWSKNPDNSLLQMASSAKKEISDLEKKLQQPQDIDNRLLSAKTLRAQGELASSGYDYYQLLNGKYSENAYMELTNIYKNLNNISIAIDYAKSTLDINQKNAKMHFLYGVMLDEAKNYEASMEQYNLALQYGDNSPELLEILENKWTQNIVNDPNNAQNYINLGAIYQKQGHFDSARIQYIKAMQMDSGDDTAYYNLASLYVAQNNIQGAIDTYNKLLMKHPNNIEIINYKAQLLYNAKRYDEALKQYELISSLDNNNKEAKDMAQDIIYNHFTGDKLVNYLGTLANNNPKSYEAQFNYALELHKNKKYITAIEYYKKAQNINPSKEETYINLAQIYLEQKDYNKAQDICERGLMMMPDNNDLKRYLTDSKNSLMNNDFELATKLYEQGKYKEAINKYQKIQDKTKEVNMAIASCYWELNDYNNANKYYLDVLSKEPNNKDALVNSAYAYFSLNDFNNAKSMAQKVLNIEKTNKEAQEIISNIEQKDVEDILNLAMEQYDKGEFNKAMTTIGKFLNKKPDDEYGLYYKALIFDELKKPKDAAWVYKTLIQKHPDFANAYYSLAVNLDNQENYKDAVSNYDKFINLSKEKSDMKDFAISRSKELKEYLGQLNAKK